MPLKNSRCGNTQPLSRVEFFSKMGRFRLFHAAQLPAIVLPMKQLLAASLILFFASALSACTDTGPIKVGPDTYTISTRVPFGGPPSAKGQALEEASTFCQSQQRDMLLDHVQSSECALHGGCGEAEIYFYCLSSDDPQLRRPKFSPDPSLKVEVDHR
jgi:hypothetical protein